MTRLIWINESDLFDPHVAPVQPHRRGSSADETRTGAGETRTAPYTTKLLSPSSGEGSFLLPGTIRARLPSASLPRLVRDQPFDRVAHCGSTTPREAAPAQSPDRNPATNSSAHTVFESTIFPVAIMCSASESVVGSGSTNSSCSSVASPPRLTPVAMKRWMRSSVKPGVV